MSSPWFASQEMPPEESRALLEQAREALIAGDLENRALARVRPVIRESWERAIRKRIDAAELPPVDLSEDELLQYRLEHPLAHSLDTIRNLLLPGNAAESGVIVAVGDHTGRFLWLEGDLQARLHTDSAGVVAGANWSEEAIGTNAPGTALAIGRSVQTRNAEHYSLMAHRWSCTAAPVFDPETRHLLGVIDVSGGEEVVAPQARMLVDATARAVESELLVKRLRNRSERKAPVKSHRRTVATRAGLHVLGRDRARLEVFGDGTESVVDLTARHAEILLMLAVHRQGLSAERLTALVYGDAASVDTLRPEMVRLRKALTAISPELAPESRPYRLPVPLETDAHDMLALLDRGAHRVALSAYHGPVLPESTAPGVEEFRETVRAALREAMFAEASLDVLLNYAEIPEGAEDVDVLRLCLEMLPARSPKRAGLVARIERLED